MLALFHKEARQVLIAHVGLAVLYSAAMIALAPEGWLFLPEERSGQTYFVAALVSMVQGLLIGMGSFGLESWGSTEAYLRHRPARSVRIFWTKALAGVLALGTVIAVPIAIYGTWHLALFPTIEGARATRLFHFAAAATAGVPAFAIGVLAARLRKAWFVRWLYALLGLCTLVLAMRWSASPLGSEVLPSASRYAGLLLSIAVLLLASASALFHAGDDVHRPWRGRAGLLAAIASLALFWTPYAVGIGTLQDGLLMALIKSYPQILERRGGELLRVARDAHHRYWMLDEEERRLASEPMNDSPGLPFDGTPYFYLFGVRSTPLTSTRPMNDLGRRGFRAGAFEFEGQVFVSYGWFVEHGISRYSSAWLFKCPPKLAALRSVNDSRTQLQWIDSRPDGARFSPETVLVFPLGVNPEYGTSLDVANVALADQADRSLWKFERRGEAVSIHPLELPDGDSFERLERIYSLFMMRVGLYEPVGVGDGLVFVGLRDRYVWTNEGFVAQSAGQPFDEALARGVLQSEVSGVQAWRLEPSGMDGISFHLDVVDVKTGEVALAHDYEPRTVKQRALAASALALSFARPPVGEVMSFVGRPYDEREVFRRAGPMLDPFVGNGVRPWLVLAVVALGLALVVSTWRWIGSAAEDRAVRWFWTLAVAALGVPAWVLCRLLEPSRRALAVRMPKCAERAVPLLYTPGDVRTGKVPALQA